MVKVRDYYRGFRVKDWRLVFDGYHGLGGKCVVWEPKKPTDWRQFASVNENTDGETFEVAWSKKPPSVEIETFKSFNDAVAFAINWIKKNPIKGKFSTK